MSRTYRELLVWKKAKQLATLVYHETEHFIAEGQGRLTKGEFRHFLGQARGSILELETQLAIAYDLGYLLEPGYRILESQSFQVLGLLNRLIESLSVDRQTMKL